MIYNFDHSIILYDPIRSCSHEMSSSVVQVLFLNKPIYLQYAYTVYILHLCMVFFEEKKKISYHLRRIICTLTPKLKKNNIVIC